MKPPVFDYLAPQTLDEALVALKQHGWGAKLLAGGQSLVPLLNFRLAEPAVLIDLNGIESLDYVTTDDTTGALKIGSMTRQRTLEHDVRVADIAPLLAEAIPWISHPQIRNRGTVGGSLAHADPAAELPVLAVALGANLRVRNAVGERSIPAQDFFLGLMTTALAPDEMLIEVEIPAMPARTGWSFIEVARRKGDYAQAGIATTVTVDGAGAVTDAKLVYLTAGEIPIRANRAESVLEEGGLDQATIEAAAALAAREEIEPTDDIHASADFKRHLAEVITRRALAVARGRLEGVT